MTTVAASVFALATLVLPTPKAAADTPAGACESAAQKLFGAKPARVAGPEDASSVQPPKKLRGATPQFPSRWPPACQGTIFINEALIAPSGKVHKVWTLRSPCSEMDEIVVKALQGWAYEPTLVAGKPVAICMTVTTSVHLR